MSTLRNRVQLIGNLGNDPEIINLESDKKLAKFYLATNESYVNKKGDKITNTKWHNIVARGIIANIIENYLNKRKEVIVVGKLTYNQYETEKGKKKYFTQIQVSELQMIGGK